MESSEKKTSIGMQKNEIIHSALQLLTLSVLIIFCFVIILPFWPIIVWAIILSITLYPLHNKITNRFKGRKWLSASLIIVFLLLLIIAPMMFLLMGSIDEFKDLKDFFYVDGKLQIPPPMEEIKNWPLIGNKVYDFWNEASMNIQSFLTNHVDAEALKNTVLYIFGIVSSAGKGIMILMISIIASGALLIYGKESDEVSKLFFVKLAGTHGEKMQKSIALTVRNVAKGVLGVSFIQSVLAGIGIILAGVPFATLWIMICLVLAIVQIGILPVSLGVIIYVWTTGSTLTAVLITIWMLFVGIVDNIIKPYMLGKGAPAPMLVVFIGSIGGFIVRGFIGLFTGAILLTLGYNLFINWLHSKE